VEAVVFLIIVVVLRLIMDFLKNKRIKKIFFGVVLKKYIK